MPNRTHKEKREAVLALLRQPEWTSQTNAAIAKEAGVSGPLVAKMRRELKDQPQPSAASEPETQAAVLPPTPPRNAAEAIAAVVAVLDNPHATRQERLGPLADFLARTLNEDEFVPLGRFLTSLAE